MAMSRSRGTLPPPDPNNAKQCFDVPAIDPKEVEYSTVPINTEPVQGLNAEEFVKRSVSDLGTIDSDSQDLSAIQAYIEGSGITVTFYTQLTSDSYGRSTINTFSETLDPIHQRYRKIVNFQMKLKDQVQFQYNIENTESGVEGEAVLYPYFCPYQGDMFIYATGTNKLGLFKITEPPQRLSIETATCHTIKFILITWITNDILAKLNDCVVDVAYFNLDSYLNSKGGFLTSDEDALKGEVQKALARLKHFYINTFLEQKIYHTFIENACLYDPYIVEFCLRLFDSRELPIYPVQLKPNPAHWTECFWYMLLDPDYTPESSMVTSAIKAVYKVNYRTTGVTALTNRCYIELKKGLVGAKPYPPFVIPAKWDAEEITVPMQVRLYLSQSKVFPEALLQLAKQALSTRRISQFYFIPILIFLLKKLLAALISGDKSIIYKEEKPQSTGCVCDCNDCLFNCNPPHLRSISKCPGHAHHQCSFSGDCNSIYIPPCGGCSTDSKQYPDLYNTTAAVSTVDISKQKNQLKGYNIGNTVSPGVPYYGPRVPVIENKPTSWLKYMKLKKIADYMYRINIPYADYEAGISRVNSYANIGSGCSSFRAGKYHVRCLDYYYDECAYFVTMIPRSEHTKYASMAICAAKTVTKAIAESGQWNDVYGFIACFVFDGINDQGLVVNQNIVPSADNPLRPNAENHVTGTKPGYRNIPTAVLLRYLLDNAKNVDDAIALIRSVNIYTVEKALPGFELHFMLSDATKTVVVEIVDNKIYIHDKSVMTNFYLTGYDGVTTNICKEIFEPGGIPRNQTVTKHGCGLERYKYITDNIPVAPSVALLSTMVDNLLYSHSYKQSTVPFWYSEYYDGNLTIDTPIAGFAASIADLKAKYEANVRDGSTWRTTHASIYDIAEKKLVLRVQEKEDLYTIRFGDCLSSIKDSFIPVKFVEDSVPIQCDHPVLDGPPYPPDHATPYEDTSDTAYLIMPRPNVDKKVSLIVEYSENSNFTSSTKMIDTRINPSQELQGSVIDAVVSGFDGAKYVPLFTDGVPSSISRVVVGITKPSFTVYFRYKWITIDNIDLGWNVY